MTRIDHDFWQKYDKAGELEKTDLLQTLPLLKNVKHTALPNDNRFVAMVFQSYLEDYVDYVAHLKQKNEKKK
jgi:hypothetical protein